MHRAESVLHREVRVQELLPGANLTYGPCIRAEPVYMPLPGVFLVLETLPMVSP